MASQELTPQRKKYIEEIVRILNPMYSKDSRIDFHSMAEDFGIRFMETECVTGEVAISRGDKKYVFVSRYFVPWARRYETAHAFGHVILGHSRQLSNEQDAEYFAEKLTDLTLKSGWLRCVYTVDALLRMLRNVEAAEEYACNHDQLRLDHLIEKLDSADLVPSGGR